MTDSRTDLQELIEVAHVLADAARGQIMPLFRANAAQIGLQDKGEHGFDPVTLADRAAEQTMRDLLHDLRPNDSILGEEFGARHGTSGLTWVLDPIDGTRAFLSGAPTWGVLIAIADSSGPFVGLIDQPFTQERLVGGGGRATWARGSGAAMAAQPIRTRPCASLSEALLFSTFPEVGTLQERLAFEQVAAQVRMTRFGLDCYAYALLAMGQIDLVIEAGLAPHDIAAPMALIEAAGGVVTNWQGGAANGGGQVIAAGDRNVHAQALVALAAQP